MNVFELILALLTNRLLCHLYYEAWDSLNHVEQVH
jgi:hypothetical protein